MLAWLREPSPRLEACELTHVARLPIDFRRACEQHAMYGAVLRELGMRTEFLPPLPDHADGVFVEDVAVILPELAIIARPGAESRRGEVGSVAAAIRQHLSCLEIAGGSLDGGDVLLARRTLYVGNSGRTNPEGIDCLAALVRGHGYRVETIAVRGCLHLKTAVTFIPPDIMLLNPAWIDAARFESWRVLAIDSAEPFAANTLTIGSTTLTTADSPRTAARLKAVGIATRAIDISELQKAEAGLTCLSLLAQDSA